MLSMIHDSFSYFRRCSFRFSDVVFYVCECVCVCAREYVVVYVCVAVGLSVGLSVSGCVWWVCVNADSHIIMLGSGRKSAIIWKWSKNLVLNIF